MLKINLLPEGARKATLSPIEQFHRTPMMWILAGVLVLFALSLTLPVSLRHRQLRQLTERVQILTPQKQEVEQLQRQLQQLRAQEAAFRSLGQGQGLWSKRLNVLSNVTPEGIWFTELNLDQKTGLVIQGSAIGAANAEKNVGRLVQDLKADPDFTAAVKDVQIESIKRVQDKGIEVVQFTMVCALADSTAL